MRIWRFKYTVLLALLLWGYISTFDAALASYIPSVKADIAAKLEEERAVEAARLLKGQLLSEQEEDERQATITASIRFLQEGIGLPGTDANDLVMALYVVPEEAVVEE